MKKWILGTALSLALVLTMMTQRSFATLATCGTVWCLDDITSYPYNQRDEVEFARFWICVATLPICLMSQPGAELSSDPAVLKEQLGAIIEPEYLDGVVQEVSSELKAKGIE